MTRTSRRRRGAAAVEFALVVPLLFLAVFALIESARLVMVRQALTHAAREGARQASLTRTKSAEQVESSVRDYLRSVIPHVANSNHVRITVDPEGFAEVSGKTTVSVAVQVRVADVSWLPDRIYRGDLVIAVRSLTERE